MKCVLSVVFVAVTASAQVTLSPLFTDHAVLQRNKPIPVWGTAAPGEKVDVTLGPGHVTTTADGSGAWRVLLPKLAAGGPYTLKANDAEATDILIGEVWLASGQSNMELHLNAVNDAPAVIAASAHPQLRMFTVNKVSVADPVDTLTGSWEVSSPEVAAQFSAVGYFFGRSLLEHLQIPIGIVHASAGGSNAEEWVPLHDLLDDPMFAAFARQQSDDLHNLPANTAAFSQKIIDWENRYNSHEPAPPATVTEEAEGTDWKPITLPQSNVYKLFRGSAVLWLRRTVTLPENFHSHGVHLDIGPLLERDIIFVNGKLLRRSGYDIPETLAPNRFYGVPDGMLHPGDNSIVIRAYAHSPNGQSLFAGFASVQAPTAQPGINDVYPLTGEWQYRIVFDQHLGSEALAAFPHHPRETIPHPAFGLYNGMIHPLRDFAIAGAIWYQGEGNAGRYAQLPKLMEHLIGSWRRQWHADLPFYIVQLPIFQDRNWPMMRAAQQQITRDIPNTAIAVTIDTGEVTNIHPKEKQPVGDRLALLALHRVYGLKLEDSGPFFASAQPEGAKLRISFTHAEGLHATGPAIPHFEIAGADGKFLPAEAIIEKQTIVLSNPQIPSPTAARYAWSPTPLGADVYNAANLPLAPFTTP